MPKIEPGQKLLEKVNKSNQPINIVVLMLLVVGNRIQSVSGTLSLLKFEEI